MTKAHRQIGEAMAVLVDGAGGEIRITAAEWKAANVIGRVLWAGQPDGEEDFLLRLLDRDEAAEKAALDKAGLAAPVEP